MFKRILIVIDERPASHAALGEGIALAKAHGSELVFFSVLPRYTVPMADMPAFMAVSPQEFQTVAESNARKGLAQATAAAERAGVMSRTGFGSGDDDARCIVDAARKRRCELIVVASEGRNALVRLLTGSVIPGLITSSPIPVLVCKERKRPRAGATAAPPEGGRGARPRKARSADAGHG